MAKPSPTIYEVARTAGVSIATVSRVLNDPQKVSQETRHTVLEAIEKTGFVPRAEARARAIKDNRRVGVITPFIAAPSFVQRLRGLTSAMVETRYELVIYTVDSAERLHNYLAALPLTGNLDGLIIMSLEFSQAEAERLIRHSIETVLIEYPQQVFSTIEIDDVAGGRMATEYLIKKGHRRIAFIGDNDLSEFAVHPIGKRLKGYRKTMEDAGLEVMSKTVILTPYSPEQARQATHAFFELSQPPTAIFAATDLQAIGVLKAAREMEIKVPGDLAVIGFDDLDVSELVGLTTIRQHLDESGRVAAELLLARLEDKHRAIQHITLPLKVIERETV